MKAWNQNISEYSQLPGKSQLWASPIDPNNVFISSLNSLNKEKKARFLQPAQIPLQGPPITYLLVIQKGVLVNDVTQGILGEEEV